MKLWRYGRSIEHLAHRYRLDGSLGSGGMADVCLAWDARDEREVAIKVIRPDTLDQRTLDRFLKEAAQVAKWQHPHILRVYSDLKLELLDAAQGAIVPYIVMEYAQGGDLQKRLTPGQPYPLGTTLDIFAQLCSAVAYAHEQGVIHRDLKPPNILFRSLADEPDEVVLSDFGLAVEMSATHHTFARGGTLPYMAPEQLHGHIEAASDIFALGVILYLLCTGRLPFRRSLQDLQRADAFAPPLPPSSILPTLPPALDDAILIALAEHPADRYADALQFWQSVQAAVASLQNSTLPRSLSTTRVDSGALRKRASRQEQGTHGQIVQGANGQGAGANGQQRATGQARRGTPTQTNILPDSSPDIAPIPPVYRAHARPQPSTPSIATDAHAGTPSAYLDSSLDTPQQVRIPSRTRRSQNSSTAFPPSGIQRASAVHAGATPRPTRGTHNPLRLLVPVALLLILLAGGIVYFTPAMRNRFIPTSSIPTPLNPGGSLVQSPYTIPTSSVNAHQVTFAQSQSQSIQGTGHNVVAATQAKGQVTFFNGAFIAQQVNTGMMITGKDGIQVVTEADANIPPADPNTRTDGKINVPAQAVNLGAKGNIQILDINQTCCVNNSTIFVKNTAAFIGGRDAVNYQFVQRADVQNATNPGIATLTQQVQGGLPTRLKADERMVGTPQCTPTVSSDPQRPVGDTGVNVPATRATVTVQCSAEAYDAVRLKNAIVGVLSTQMKRPGSGYKMVVRLIAPPVLRVVDGVESLVGEASGAWVAAGAHGLVKDNGLVEPRP